MGAISLANCGSGRKAYMTNLAAQAAERTYLRKRRVPRRRFERDIGVLIRGNYCITKAVEIGEGGMLFLSDIPLEKNQFVVVSFHIPGMIHIVTRGDILYRKELKDGKLGYGVRFVNIDFDARRTIRSYVALKTADEGEV